MEGGEAMMQSEAVITSSVTYAVEMADKQRRRMVDMYGYAWGRQYRRHFGVDALFPIPSLLGRLREEAEAAGERGASERRFREVFIGDALEFSRAWHQLRAFDRESAMVHYVIIGLVKQKAQTWGCEVRTYHQRRKTMQMAMVKLLGL